MLLAAIANAAVAASIDEKIDAMTDEEKIAQLLFVGLPGPIEDATLREVVGRWHVGGVVLFAHNIERPEQVRRLTEAVVRNSGSTSVPFIAVDQEGGIVHRLRLGVPVVPSAMAIGATRSPKIAHRAGAAVGSALRALGFTMNFAPVLDVLTNRDNVAIGTRAFSDDPELTAALGAAFVAGQQESGVIAVGKHFPGLGSVAEDSHQSLPRLDASLAALRKRELLPFAAAFRAGLGAIMTAHVALPRIAERTDTPATLSPRIMKGLLRDEMHFGGIAITDALQMNALARSRGAGQLAVDAVLAGSDMVLALGTSRERGDVFDTLLAAYRSGRLPKRRVCEALRRILSAKQALHRLPKSFTDDELPDHVASRAITIVPGSTSLAPLPQKGVLYLGPDGPLKTLLAPERAVTIAGHIDNVEAEAVLARIRAAAAGMTICVAAAANEDSFAIIARFHRTIPDLPLVFVNLGSPWRVLTGLRASTLLTYADDGPSQRAAARVLRGQAEAQGTVPVSLK